MAATCEGLGYDGPRGPVRLRSRHLAPPVFPAAADGLRFGVLCRL
ncbi:hypothetical protein ACSNOI_45025 [Actinomadura kijaniata]